jgi:transcriptional regulator with GAF, ATPase, and Fis domain
MPWILDLLFEFHCRGYKPIPEYEFKSELERALNGPRATLRGSAFRIKAKQAILNNETPARVEMLLRQSETELKAAGAILDLGKTRIEMARVKLYAGKEEEARELALKALEEFPDETYKAFPNELRLLLQKKSYQTKKRTHGNEMLDRYLETMEEFIPSQDREILLSRLMVATSRFFEAERGAIFWFNKKTTGEEPLFRVGFGITVEEIGNQLLWHGRKHIIEAFETQQPVIGKAPHSAANKIANRPAAFLCLPFNLKDRASGVLYYENNYSKGAFEFLNRSMLMRITENMSSYILRILEYSQNLEDKTLSVIRDSTVPIEFYENEIIAQSPIMLELLTNAHRAAESDAPILIMGETGVGKGLMARHLHQMSSRHSLPFIAVNLSVIPESLIESELFGHEKGAFTGAERQKIGRMELANMGTLFIDEIGETDKSVQVKILQAIEEKTFFRVGGSRNINSNFRLIAATNQDLKKEVRNGNFREDLFYRLNVIPLILPPLRERGDDIVLLAKHYLVQFSKKYSRKIPELTRRDEEILKRHHWPGNIRELKNVVEQALILSPGNTPLINMLINSKKQTKIQQPSINPFSDHPTMDEMQRRYLTYIREKTGGKVSGPGSMSEILGMKRTTLQTRMKKLGI